MQAGGKRIAQGPGARPVRLLTMRKIAVALLIVTLGSGCAGVNRHVRKAIGDREPKLWFAVAVWGAAIAGALATKDSYWCDRFRPNAYRDDGAWKPYGPCR